MEDEREFVFDLFYDVLVCEDLTQTNTVLGFLALLSFVSWSILLILFTNVLQIYIILFWSSMFMNLKCFEEHAESIHYTIVIIPLLKTT